MKPLTLPEIRAQSADLSPAMRREILADFLDTLPPHKFDMNEWWKTSECGTRACIAGWAVELFGQSHEASHADTAGKLLGIPYFFGHDKHGRPHLFLDTSVRTPQEAASRLRSIA